MSELPQELLDSAARMRDAINIHVVAGALGVRDRNLCWVAIKLEDGRSDGNLYESRKDAVIHTRNKGAGYFYALVKADTMGERESIIVLQQARQAYSKGVVFAEEQVVTPMLSELLLPFIPRTIHALDKRS